MFLIGGELWSLVMFQRGRLHDFDSIARCVLVIGLGAGDRNRAGQLKLLSFVLLKTQTTPVSAPFGWPHATQEGRSGPSGEFPPELSCGSVTSVPVQEAVELGDVENITKVKEGEDVVEEGQVGVRLWWMSALGRERSAEESGEGESKVVRRRMRACGI